MRHLITFEWAGLQDYGHPGIAKIVPIAEGDPVAERARSALLARLRAERVTNVGRWTRDELYDDEP